MSCICHNAKPGTVKDPIRIDPTRTSMIRRGFMNEIKKRINRFKRALREFLLEKDALALKRGGFTFNVEPKEFQFLTDAEKVAAFSAWMAKQLEADVLLSVHVPNTVRSFAATNSPWTAKYIESAYKKALVNTYLAARRNREFDFMTGKSVDAFLSSAQEEFLRTAFLAPERLSKVQLLATRSFEQLKGVTATMSSQMNQILAQGMIDGKSVTQIAQEMSEKIDGLTNSRAMTIARTEVIAAHAEGQLDAFKEMGVVDLQIQAEWSTAGDGRVCSICAQLEGQVFTIDEARGMIPIHPNCRCSWLSVIPSEKKK